MALIASEVAVIRPWRPALHSDSPPKLSRCCSSAPSRGGVCSAFRFEKPRRLLRSEDVPDDHGELGSDTQQLGECDFLYKVQLVTSNRPKSGFSEFSGRVSLVLVGEEGKCVMRFFEAAYGSGTSRKLRFQKGDVDVFEFIAPDPGQLQAIWIGPSIGSWRLEEATVTITPREAGAQKDPAVYVFQSEGQLLGDRGDVLAIELRPVKEKVPIPKEIREAWLKEYNRLKASLLLWDAALVGLGSGLLYAAGYREIALTFAIGGAAGFFYLFLLQAAVDQLGKEDYTIFTDIKQPAVRLGLVLAFVFVVARTLELQGTADWSDTLTKEEFLGGTAGLLVYKAALALATIKESINE